MQQGSRLQQYIIYNHSKKIIKLFSVYFLLFNIIEEDFLLKLKFCFFIKKMHVCFKLISKNY